jgi:hypothetical protein
LVTRQYTTQISRLPNLCSEVADALGACFDASRELLTLHSALTG